MPYLNQLIEGYRRFRENRWAHERERWAELAEGQNPQVMILACADSRSDPAGGWRNYLLSDVSALQVLDAPFAGTRPGYVAHDPRMREVYCELTPTEESALTEGPFIVREPSAGTSPTRPSRPADEEADASEAVQHPADLARTHDGEADPPAAAP